MTTQAPARASQHSGSQHSAFRNLVAVEAKLMVREIVPLLWGLVFPWSC